MVSLVCIVGGIVTCVGVALVFLTWPGVGPAWRKCGDGGSV